jgi:serine/threonine protein kinase
MSEDYVVGAAIGDGLMGPRYAGRYRPSGHPVALEQVPRALSGRPEFVDRLARAAKAAHAVTESHVVAVYDLVRLGPDLYVVTELVRARRLTALLGAERSLPLPAALTIADSVLAGLEEIHRAGLSHGDVSPDVVVITPAGGVRITELGVAAVLAADPAVPGCPAVEPPEGDAPSQAADLYGAGALLRELVSGLRPEQAGPWAGPGSLEPLVVRSLAPAAADRFPTAGAFRRELQGAAAGLLGTGWRVQSDLAVRVSRPLGPQAPRRRSDRTVRVASAGEPAAVAAVAPGAAAGEDPPGGSAPGPRPGTPPGSPSPDAPPPSPGSSPPSAPLPPSPGSRPPGAPPPPSPSQRPAPPAEPAEVAVTAAPPESPAPEPPPPPAAPPLVGVDPFGPAFSSSPAAAGGVTSGHGAPRRRRRRGLAIALALLIVIAAAAAAWLVVLSPTPPTTSTPAPLAIANDVHLTVRPGPSGGCGTTFSFTATGTVSGAGTLTYRWVKSVAGSAPVYDQYSLAITTHESSFSFPTSLQLTGPASLEATVTFEVISPQARSAAQTIQYTCAH